MPQPACEDGISGGRDVHERVPAHRVPLKRRFDRVLKAQQAALQRKFDARLKACSSAATTAPEPPRIDSGCGEEKRPLASEGGAVQEFVPTHRFPMKDCSFECALTDLRAELQRKLDARSTACPSAVTTAPESFRIDSDCGEEVRPPLALDGGAAQELDVPAHRFPMKDCSFECALKAQADALQRTIDAHLKALSSAATNAPESPHADSDYGVANRRLASEGGAVQELVPTHRASTTAESSDSLGARRTHMELPEPASRPKASRRRGGRGLVRSDGALIASDLSEAISPPHPSHMPQPFRKDGISGGRDAQELVDVHRVPMKDSSFECALKAQRAELQRKLSTHLKACSSAATTAPEFPRIDPGCGEEERPLASEGGAVQEFVPAHVSPVHDCSFECALKAGADALQRLVEAHMNACSSAATKAPESPRTDSGSGPEKHHLAAAGASGHTMCRSHCGIPSQG